MRSWIIPVSLDDALILATNVDKAAVEVGFFDIKRSKGKLIAALRTVQRDGKVALRISELESAMWCCGMLDELGLFVPTAAVPTYNDLVNRVIPKDKIIDPFFFTIRSSDENV